MGWDCSWIAVRGKSPDVLLDALGKRLSDDREETPESPWTMADLSGGWRVVFRNGDCAPRLFADPALEALSKGCELVHSSVEEHVMFCSTAFWQDGVPVWAIVHDAQKGIFHLVTSGNLPSEFEEIRGKNFSDQQAEGGEDADVDLIFEIPLEMGRLYTGFRHDYDYPTEADEPFYVLMDLKDRSGREREKRTRWRFW